MSYEGKTLEEFKTDLLGLEKQVIAIQGAMQYIGQQIVLLEQKEEEPEKSEGGDD